jgi:hypothetical protein
VIFSSNIIKTPESSRDGAKKEKKKEKRKKEEEKEKLQESSNKGEVNILKREKHLNVTNPF